MGRGRGPAPSTLPANLTSFVGREREIAEVTRLLAAARLVTLTGTGGCGKSRLAVEVARGLQKDFPDGVWAVELAALSAATLVPYAVAAVLAVPEHPGAPMVATLGKALRAKTILLVLDNCEHLRDACAHLADALLRECPGLRILATSREPLDVPGETIWRVPSLSLPDLRRLPPPNELISYEAVRLFVERGVSNHPGFQLTRHNAQRVAEVCHRLDGIPLAIELAAARVRILTVEQIAERLDDRFHLLTGGSQMVLPRHQTLRATIDWSYDLLSGNERTVLRRLSVFAGGWTLEAAEAVCAGNDVAEHEILDLLTQLVDRSLVMTETAGAEARYRLLETVRQYGWEHLLGATETSEVRLRHCNWYLRFVEDAEPRLDGAEQAAWLNRLDKEHDNLRGALEWSIENAPEAGLRLTGALGKFWMLHGYFAEGRAWFERALGGSDGGSARLRAKARNNEGLLAMRQRDYVATRSFCEESLAIYQELGDQRGVADATYNLGQLASNEANFAAAIAHFERSLESYRQLRYQAGIADSLSDLGHAAWHQGNYAMARRLLEESIVLARESGRNKCLAFGLWSLGLVAFDERNYVAARALYKEGLPIAKEVGDPFTISLLLEALASLEAALKQAERAARLLGAAEALREAKHCPLPRAHRADYDRPITEIRDRLSQEAFAAAWASGRAMTMEEAIECALAPEEAAAHHTRGAEQPATDQQMTILSLREREVAALIAQGMTNREIATRLVVAERTAEGHVQSILNKLGVNSRAQIAVWAVEHGLRTGSANG